MGNIEKYRITTHIFTYTQMPKYTHTHTHTISLTRYGPKSDIQDFNQKASSAEADVGTPMKKTQITWKSPW